MIKCSFSYLTSWKKNFFFKSCSLFIKVYIINHKYFYLEPINKIKNIGHYLSNAQKFYFQKVFHTEIKFQSIFLLLENIVNLCFYIKKYYGRNDFFIRFYCQIIFQSKKYRWKILYSKITSFLFVFIQDFNTIKTKIFSKMV